MGCIFRKNQLSLWGTPRVPKWRLYVVGLTPLLYFAVVTMRLAAKD